jgi:hypothetical protein
MRCTPSSSNANRITARAASVAKPLPWCTGASTYQSIASRGSTSPRFIPARPIMRSSPGAQIAKS